MKKNTMTTMKTESGHFQKEWRKESKSKERYREEGNIEETDKMLKPEENLIQGTKGNSLNLHHWIKNE